MTESVPVVAGIMKLMEAIGAEVTFIDGAAEVIASTAGSRFALGYDESFWATANLFDLAHPDDVARAQDAFSRILATPGMSGQERFRARHAAGHWETIEIYGHNLLADPDIGALVLTTRSVTLEEDLRSAHEQAIHAATAQSEYVASVSHELRSPLQGILGVAQLLEDQVTGEPAELLGLIRDEAERLRRVIDDILDYAKASQARMELDPKPTDIRRVLDAVAGIVGPQLLSSVELRIDVDPAVAEWVLVDDLRLHQVLLNLAANAARFTAEGVVRIHCRPATAGRLYFAVEDSGIGIDQDRIQSLFEPFRQGVPSQDYQGTGLGLTISKELVELMGGRLDVESMLGKGSMFAFAVEAPVTRPRAEAESTFAPVAANEGLVKALVIDDAEVNLLVIGRQLESMGFEVHKAGSGATGVEMAIAESFELIVVDWHMPEVDGLEATRRIRSHEAGVDRHTPILSMTASAMPGDAEKCLAAGVDGFLAKPATRSELSDAVSNLLHTTASRRDPGSATRTAEPRPSSGKLAQVAVELETLTSLCQDLGDATVATVVQTYLGDLDTRGAALLDAAARDDIDAARREAHTLKSPSWMLGATELGRLCHEIEVGELELSAQTAADFQKSIDAARNGLWSWVDEIEENLE